MSGAPLKSGRAHEVTALPAPRPLGEYLAALLEEFGGPVPPVGPSGNTSGSAMEIPEQVFKVLIAREFCYLSHSRVEPYRADILKWLSQGAELGGPLRFYYDIGGGYHATLRPDEEDVCFDVGLAELLVLRQIHRFAAQVRGIYPAGVRFTLVIDNLCALLINDIPVARTAGYCSRLRALIRAMGMEATVELLVESEHFTPGELEQVCADARRSGERPVLESLSAKDHQNIERFLGRSCNMAEALERANRYREVTGASEQLLNTLIAGVHMTQRASASTLCFRPFPGGDSRIQSGEVAILADADAKMRPVLLTSRSLEQYEYCRYFRFPGRLAALVPDVIPYIAYAQHRASSPL